MFFPDRPVRLANNRYEQFQSGIKRHAFKMHTRIGIDRATGKIRGFAADHVLDGGGLANYSANVSTVSATAALGIYDIPKVDITTIALHSRGVTAGSMRGYGTLQTMTALEVLIDEAAAALPLDPIEFRRRNALKSGGRIMTGNQLQCLPSARRRFSTRSSSIRSGNNARRRRRAGRRAASPSAPASPAPPRITVAARTARRARWKSTRRAGSPSTAIMSIWATASARRWPIGWRSISAAWPMTSRVHDVDAYGPLALVTSGNSYTMDQATQDAAAKNPRWVPAISAATFASNGAHVGTQAAAEAARVIFRFGLWPAALDLWGIAPTHPTAKQWEAARWKDGNLLMPGLAPLVVARDRGQGPCASRRDGSHGARFLALGVVAGEFPHRRTDMERRYRRAGRAQGQRQIRVPRSVEREISADREQPLRPRLHGRVRQPWSASRSSAPPAYCASPKATACSNAAMRWCRKSSSDRRKAASPWASATRCWKRCRSTRTGPATANGISVNT